MGEDMNGYQPPVVEGLDGDDSSGVSTYGTEWVWETYYVMSYCIRQIIVRFFYGIRIKENVLLQKNILI